MEHRVKVRLFQRKGLKHHSNELKCWFFEWRNSMPRIQSKKVIESDQAKRKNQVKSRMFGKSRFMFCVDKEFVQFGGLQKAKDWPGDPRFLEQWNVMRVGDIIQRKLNTLPRQRVNQNFPLLIIGLAEQESMCHGVHHSLGTRVTAVGTVFADVGQNHICERASHSHAREQHLLHAP